MQPPSKLEAEATGELEGTGRWTLTSADGGTLVRYDWDVRTTKRWMNLLAPVARPVFNWNHRELMRAGGESLARRLDGDLAFSSARTQPSRLRGPHAGSIGGCAGGAGRAGMAQEDLGPAVRHGGLSVRHGDADQAPASATCRSCRRCARAAVDVLAEGGIVHRRELLSGDQLAEPWRSTLAT